MLEEPSFDPFQQPPLVQALLVALHTLVVHNSMEVTSEGQTWTLEALPGIVGPLQDAGYEFVTMQDLFAA